jgi:hypothetical protein
MSFKLSVFNRDGVVDGLDAEYLEWLVEQRWPQIQAHFGKMWEYYANPIMDLQRGANPEGQ